MAPQPLPTPSWFHPSLISDLGSELVLWEDRLPSRTSPSEGWSPCFCGLKNALGSSQQRCVYTYRKTVGVFPPHHPLHFQRPEVSYPLYKVVFPLLTGLPLAKPPASMRSACAMEKHLQTLSPLLAPLSPPGCSLDSYDIKCPSLPSLLSLHSTVTICDCLTGLLLCSAKYFVTLFHGSEAP